MKASLFALFAAIAAVVLYLVFGKSTKAVQGGCIPVGPPQPGQQICNTASANQTTAPAISNIKANGGQLWSSDQETMNKQPDVSSQLASIAPLVAWNPTTPIPTDIIGNPTGMLGTPSGSTFPAQNPIGTTAPEVIQEPMVALSPTFWAADAVPQNPYLANGLTGPNYTQ